MRSEKIEARNERGQPVSGFSLLASRSSLLRVLACGSVDDGKSTLIGRLVYETGAVFDDQLAALKRDSRKYGTTGEDIDFALLLDGLEAEREQGITIDVAYRYFATARRKFIIADAPGHEEYTRNMATGASNSDAAVILADARKGVLPQTRRHAHIASLLGIRHVILAVNKMDLAGYSQSVFSDIAGEFGQFTEKLSFAGVTAIPVSARRGENVVRRSEQMAWYTGPVLLEHLETLDVDADVTRMPLRFAVQWVNRPNGDFRGFAGTVLSGVVSEGQEIVVAASGSHSRVRRIVTHDGDLKEAITGQAVTLVLADEIGISRGDVLTSPQARCETADQFAAHVIWFARDEMYPHREYLLKFGNQTVPGRITALKHKLDVNTLEHVAARSLHLNEIGLCNVATRSAVAFDSYDENRETGAFIIIDRQSNATLGAGMIAFALRRAANVHWQALEVNAEARARVNAQTPCALWFTGLSGAGKSTIANLVEKRLFADGRRSYLLDGDNVRHGLNRDLGFTATDRIENIRRVAEVSRLFVDAGLITLVSFISPFAAERQMARELFQPGQFHEIFVDTPLDVCKERDPKGLYARAAGGNLKNFTGIDSPYEAPLNPELTLATANATPEELADRVITYLKSRRLIP
ncbi:MAG: sulfate adenylyltransferase subunit CysN [Alphaproteobacteria bacterium]|nr:sulfate adenylyltransferase subunit CysN [Alphaproteobacteria bacterium]